MYASRAIEISGRIYQKNTEVDRYQIPVDELGDLRMCDTPPCSHLEVLRLPQPTGAYDLEVFALHSDNYQQDGSLEVYGGASFRVSADEKSRVVARLHRAFPDLDPERESFLRNPYISTHADEKGMYVNFYMNLKFTDRPRTLVRDAVVPFIEGFRRMERPSANVFICHASEDKAAARAVASAMARLGAEVWFDEWEIKVGQSIVQRINHALGKISHLVVLLSENSVKKPWVHKELSAALMRQLSQDCISILPLRLDECSIPPILADIKYADGRNGIEYALADLELALFSSAEGNGGA
jgi:hypothetical protein